MIDLNARADRVTKEFAGNEALLDMLETEAAVEMLAWGTVTARSVVNKTAMLDDAAADLMIMPAMKAIRQSMRSVGNWAAGKYTDPASRIQLRDKLLEHFRIIFGEETPLPSGGQMDDVLNQVDDKSQSPYQLILKLRELLDEPR